MERTIASNCTNSIAGVESDDYYQKPLKHRHMPRFVTRECKGQMANVDQEHATLFLLAHHLSTIDGFSEVDPSLLPRLKPRICTRMIRAYTED